MPNSFYHRFTKAVFAGMSNARAPRYILAFALVVVAVDAYWIFSTSSHTQNAGADTPDSMAVSTLLSHPSRRITPTSDIDVSAEISELVELSSTEALKNLLAFNGRTLPPGEQVKATHVFADLIAKNQSAIASDRMAVAKLQGILGAADYFTSDGKEFVFASVARPSSHSPYCSTSDLYLFTSEGTLVADLEGSFDSAGINADTLTVTDLGSERFWFALFTRFDEPDSEFQQITRVYFLSETPELALVIHHHANNMSFPIFRSKEWRTLSHAGIYYTGRARDLRPPQLGKDSSGQRTISAILWDDDNVRFFGPGSVFYREQSVLEVESSVERFFKQTTVSRLPLEQP